MLFSTVVLLHAAFVCVCVRVCLSVCLSRDMCFNKIIQIGVDRKNKLNALPTHLRLVKGKNVTVCKTHACAKICCQNPN